jgi:RNA polymerase sigma factor (sigma-70 family)
MSFDILIKRVSPTLQRITQKLNGRFSFMDHDDLFQEAVLRLWIDFQGGRLEAKTDSYILQGCYFHLKNYIRKMQGSATVVSLNSMIDEESGRLEELIEADEVDAIDYVDGKMQVEALLAEGVSDRERDVLAFSMEGMTTREIGEKLGISHVAVVKVRNRIRERWERLHGPRKERLYKSRKRSSHPSQNGYPDYSVFSTSL